jgi:hypothetical protein
MRFSVLIACLGMTTAAFAGDNDAALQTQVFGHAIDKEAAYACYTRSYDAAHLAAHPKQNVTTAMLLLTGKPKTGENSYTAYTAGVDFTFRKQKKHFQAFGDCPSVSADASSGAAQKLACGIDCDGGTIAVKLKDVDTILVSLPSGIAVSEAGNDSAPPDGGHFGSDDSVFKLSRAPLRNCLPLAIEDEDKAALKKSP